MVIKRFWPLIILIVLLVACPTTVFAAEAKIVAYYFHGNVRCPTCYKIEQYAKEAVEENFQDELDSGVLVFKALNVEEKVNEHYISDYQLFTKTLIISRLENGKEIEYKNLTKIWEYVRDRKRFFDYVATEINNYLKGNQ